jgi:putative sterol carrier protein
MSDLPLYWTAAQTAQYVEALNQDEVFQKAARKFDDTVVFRCFDTPEGNDIEVRYRIQHGKVTETRREEHAPSRSLRDAPFDRSTFARTSAPYAVWTKLDKGEMNVLQALASPEYQVEGPKLKIMTNIGVFNAMSAVASRLPKRYA